MSTIGRNYGDGTTTHFSSDLIVGAREPNANVVGLLGAVASAAPSLIVTGDDTNVSLQITCKGTGVLILPSVPVGKSTVSTLTTAGVVTYTAAQLMGGLILRDPNGAGRSDVTPTAALLAAAIPGVAAGTSFEFTIRNDADAAETITVTAGVGGTMKGTATIAQSNIKRFLVVFTSTSAYDCYSLGTSVF